MEGNEGPNEGANCGERDRTHVTVGATSSSALVIKSLDSLGAIKMATIWRDTGRRLRYGGREGRSEKDRVRWRKFLLLRGRERERDDDKKGDT